MEVLFPEICVFVGSEPFQTAYRHGLIHLSAAADLLARAKADAAQHCGEGDLLSDDRLRLGVLAVGDQSDVSGYINVGGTSCDTGYQNLLLVRSRDLRFVG